MRWWSKASRAADSSRPSARRRWCCSRSSLSASTCRSSPRAVCVTRGPPRRRWGWAPRGFRWERECLRARRRWRTRISRTPSSPQTTRAQYFSTSRAIQRCESCVPVWRHPSQPRSRSATPGQGHRLVFRRRHGGQRRQHGSGVVAHRRVVASRRDRAAHVGRDRSRTGSGQIPNLEPAAKQDQRRPAACPSRCRRARSHGQVISAQTQRMRAVAVNTYHGHGPNTSSRDAVEGFRLRKP